MNRTAQQAAEALRCASGWPDLLHFEQSLEADYDNDRKVWRLSQGSSYADVDDGDGKVVAGRWQVKPIQAWLQMLTTTGLAVLGVYGLASAAKFPAVAMTMLVAALAGPLGPLLVGLLSLAFLAIWGSYLLAYLADCLGPTLSMVAERKLDLPDHPRWREPLRLLAIAQAIYVLDAISGAIQRHEVAAPLLFAMAMQVIVIGGCCSLNAARAWRDVLGWSALWALSAWVHPLIGAIATLLVAAIAANRMRPSFPRGLLARNEAKTTIEKIFWLVMQLMVFASMGALLGHCLYWGSTSLHPRLSDDVAKQAWVWGATVGTFLALCLAPLGPLRIPLFIASSLYQALLAKLGPGPALVGAVAVIFVQAWHQHPRQPLRVLNTAATFGLADTGGRLLGGCLGLFFLGFEGGPVGAALGERLLGALSLLKAEEAP